MRVARLTIANVRCVQAAELSACAGLNLLLGANGAGKTSVLESLYLLGSGKSFRFGGHEAVITRGLASLQVYAEIEVGERLERVGLERARSGWRALRNGAKVSELAELASLVPVVCFSPESHELVAGGAEVRRRFFDWVVFHVEPEFAEAHRRYSRALRQRNAVLKQAPTASELSVWTRNLSDAGELVAALRARLFPAFAEGMMRTLADLIPELGSMALRYKRGWRDGMSLYERLQLAEPREREVGHTLAGPHRGDWIVTTAGHEVREQGSRGQQKLVALGAVLVAARIYRERVGQAPIVALDDLASELDADHQRRALVECAALGAQLWVTGTERMAALDAWSRDLRVFHVEQGIVRAADDPRGT